MELIDIVVPNYRYGRYLRTCIDSVRSQPLRDMRILIIDNASDDDSAAIAQDLATEDPRITFVSHQTNLGQHASFNEGIAWARAKYMTILCADDILAPQALVRALDVLEANPGLSFAYGREQSFTDLPPPDVTLSVVETTGWQVEKGTDFIRGLCAEPDQLLAAGSFIVRTSLQKKAGLYRPELPYSDDWEMMMRLALIGDVARTAAVQAYRREHAASQSHVAAASRLYRLRERERAFESFFGLEGRALPHADAWLARAQSRLGEIAYWAALESTLRREDGARDLWSFSAARRPHWWFIPPLAHALAKRRPSCRISTGTATNQPV